jgi:hypothetical protein
MSGDERTPTSRDRRFYLWSASFLAVIILAGFARTYYFRGYFHSPQLRPFLHYHGAVMTAWIVLFIVQTVLIARRRVWLHRILGYFGAVLAALVVIMGSAATILAAVREVRAQTALVPLQLNVLALELTQMALFGVLVGIALRYRRRPDLHKRCMLLATLCMLPNPELRMMPFIHNNLLYLTIWSAQIFLFVAIDAIRNHRIHPAFLRAAIAANLALYAVQFGSTTDTWRHFASSIITERPQVAFCKMESCR